MESSVTTKLTNNETTVKDKMFNSFSNAQMKMFSNVILHLQKTRILSHVVEISYLFVVSMGNIIRFIIWIETRGRHYNKPIPLCQKLNFLRMVFILSNKCN